MIVDKLGSIICEIELLLKPMIANYSGILSPLFLVLTPIISLEANIPSGGIGNFIDGNVFIFRINFKNQ